MKLNSHNVYECAVTGRTCKARTLSKARRALRSGQVRLKRRWFRQIFSTSTMEVRRVS